MNASTVTRTVRILLGGARGGACGVALGQTAPSDASASLDTAPGLQEIVVTATRREESLSSVPISVSAYTQETLDEKGVKDMADLVRHIPGVSIDKTGTNAISIRGISSSGGAGTTGIYIDDPPARSTSITPSDHARLASR